MVLKVKLKRIKHKILNMKIKDRIFRSQELHSIFVYLQRFVSVFHVPGMVLGLEIRMINNTDKDLCLPVACIIVEGNH